MKPLLKVKKRWSTLELVVLVLLVFYAAILAVLALWGLLSSVKTDYDFRHNLFGLPEEWRFDNYLHSFFGFYVEVQRDGVQTKVYMPEMFWNSLLYAGGCALVATYIPCQMAYATSRFKYRFSRIITAVVIVCMALPIVGSLPSEIQTARSLRLYNTIPGMWLMKAHFLSVYFLIFQGVFKNVPNAYVEAAKIDGASNFTIYTRIMLPLASKTFLTVFLLNFIVFWNDYQTPLIFMPDKPTVAYGLYEFSKRTVSTFSSVPLKLAGAGLVLLPVLILFLIFQRKLMGNLSVGGIK